jgi:hypothetical protein
LGADQLIKFQQIDNSNYYYEWNEDIDSYSCYGQRIPVKSLFYMNKKINILFWYGKEDVAVCDIAEQLLSRC